jgi:hypothetical protein
MCKRCESIQLTKATVLQCSHISYAVWSVCVCVCIVEWRLLSLPLVHSSTCIASAAQAICVAVLRVACYPLLCVCVLCVCVCYRSEPQPLRIHQQTSAAVLVHCMLLLHTPSVFSYKLQCYLESDSQGVMDVKSEPPIMPLTVLPGT